MYRSHCQRYFALSASQEAIPKFNFKISAQTQPPPPCYQNVLMIQSSIHKIKNSSQITNSLPLRYIHTDHFPYPTMLLAYVCQKDERGCPGNLQRSMYFPLSCNECSLYNNTPLFDSRSYSSCFRRSKSRRRLQFGRFRGFTQ